MATNQSASQKIVVFRDDGKTFVFRKSPNPLVVYPCKPHIPHVATLGKAGQENINEAEIIADFPELTSEDIRACLAFAAAMPPCSSQRTHEDTGIWRLTAMS